MKTSLISEQHTWAYFKHANVIENLMDSTSQKFKYNFTETLIFQVSQLEWQVNIINKKKQKKIKQKQKYFNYTANKS